MPRSSSPEDWQEVEQYVGSALPADFKAFLDAYGSGAICDELTVFHPRGSSPLLERMRATHRVFAERRESALGAGDTEDIPYPFHPEPGGLISWGCDPSGDEHFFLPCDPDPDRWKVVTMVHEVGCETFDGPFAAFALDFVRQLTEADPAEDIDPDVLEFLEPEELAELMAEEGEPVRPGFRRF